MTVRGSRQDAPADAVALVRVVDGDTIHVCIGSQLEKVRYIGVNAPELHQSTKGEQSGRA